MEKETMRIFPALIILAVLTVLEIVRELHTFKITHYTVTSARLTGGEKKVVVLSDLHNKVYGEKNEKLLSAVKRERPDAILIAGDMLVGDAEVSPKPALDLVKALVDIAPVFYANGNHEQKMRENPERYKRMYEKYYRELVAHKVVYLENRSAVREWKEDLVTISGLEIPYAGYARGRYEKVRVSDIEKRIGTASQASYQILIAHNPAHAKAYRDWGADLVVSGHFHGGIVRIPGVGGVITPQLRLFPRYDGGMYQDGKTTFVVSRGIGEHTLPVRLFNTPEVVVLNMKGKKEWEYR